jgi:hypothetical protein
MSSDLKPGAYDGKPYYEYPTQKDPIDIGVAHQLFLDDYLIESKDSVHRRVNQPTKQAGPTMVADKPWEGYGLVFGNIVEVDGKYRLYYKACNLGGETAAEYVKRTGHGKHLVCMAESEDGEHFVKKEIAGASLPNSNVVLDSNMDDFCIVHDRNETNPEHRFKMLSSVDNWFAGLSSATSPDGIKWTWRQKHVVPYLGDRMCYWWDPVKKKHVAWSRNYAIIGVRTITQVETSDFTKWADPVNSHPRLIIAPDRHDHPDTEIYGGYAFHYHSLYIAYVEVYYKQQQRIDTQLACSRDGKVWKRMVENQMYMAIDAGGNVVNKMFDICSRDVFLPNGTHGEFDAYWTVPTFNPPVYKDGKLIIHYEGRPDPHPAAGFSHVKPSMSGAFGKATLREDGFVSLDATGTVGKVLTRILKLPAGVKGLDINACIFNNRAGYDPMGLGVDIISAETGQVIESFNYTGKPSLDQIWLSLEATKAWPEQVRIRFHLKNGRLYSFRARV